MIAEARGENDVAANEGLEVMGKLALVAEKDGEEKDEGKKRNDEG